MESRLVYQNSFIGIAESTEPTKRATSAPPRMKLASPKDDIKGVGGLRQEDIAMKLQVSTLLQRSDLLRDDGTWLPPSQMVEMEATSDGSYLHPNICCRPCILFAHGACEQGANCGYCHLPHERRPTSLDKLHRDYLRQLPEVTAMKMFLPYIRKHVEACQLPRADLVLQVLVSEISIRSHPNPPAPKKTPYKLASGLQRMTFTGLVSALCSVMPGHRFPKEMSNELEELRQSVKEW